jgi:hypothetical protein
MKSVQSISMSFTQMYNESINLFGYVLFAHNIGAAGPIWTEPSPVCFRSKLP